jgi:hypothetical protein
MTRSRFVAIGLLVTALSLPLAAGCSGGYRVVRSAADVDLAPGAIALVHEAPDDPHEAAFATAFTDALRAELPPAFVLGDASVARYRLHVREVRVGAVGEGVRGQARLALLDETGTALDVVDVEAADDDASRAGSRAAAHFARFLRERRQHVW